MNLYRLTTSEELDRTNTFDSVLVCAKTAEEAQKYDPRVFQWPGRQNTDVWKFSWAQDIANVTATLLGIADESVELGIVMVSFNPEPSHPGYG